METNPFRPPPSTQQSEDDLAAPRSVFVGGVVGIGTWYVGGSLYAQAFSWWLTADGVPVISLFNRMYTSVPWLLFGHALAVPCLAVGGFAATRTAARPGSAAALLAGLFLTLFTLLQFATPYSLPLPWWSRTLSVLLPIPAYLLGAAIHRRRAAQRAVVAPSNESGDAR